jgi:hypothetical protein
VPLIDHWLPDFDVGTRHVAAVAAAPERTIDLILATPAAPDRLVAALFEARGMPARGRTIEDFFRSHPFDVLGRAPTEWAAALDREGIKIAIEFRAERIPGGSRLTTETRVKCLDDRARRAFGLYWLAVGPFSSLIRRRWLRAAQAAARH